VSATAGPFLRPTHPQRRRRRSALLRAMLRVARLLPTLVLPAAAWFWLSDGQTFALSAVETQGSPRISPDWIERALEPELGSNLLTLPLDRVRRRLEAHPWLGRIEARKELPDVLRVSVEERVAMAVLETEDGLYFVDSDGERIARFEPGDTAGTLLRIAAGATSIGISPALATSEAASVRRAIALQRALVEANGPGWRLPPLWTEVVGDDDFRLYLGELPFSILVRSEGVAQRIELLERLRPEILDRVEAIAEVDLRFDSRVIVRPGEPPPESAPINVSAPADGAGGTEPAHEADTQPTRSTLWNPQPKET
jgi:cell division septal protein FtsQ